MKNTKHFALYALDKIKDKTADVLSFPARKYYGLKSKLVDRQMSRLKDKRKYREMDMAKVPDKGDESDPLFRYRINALNEAFDKEQGRLKTK